MQYIPPSLMYLDATGEFLGGSLIGPHDNGDADPELLSRCLECLDLVGAN